MTEQDPREGLKPTLKEQEFPDCAFCAPCRCDDECGCSGAVCWACGHWYDIPSKKVFLVTEREASDSPTALKRLRDRLDEARTWGVGESRQQVIVRTIRVIGEVIQEIDALQEGRASAKESK